VGPTPANASGEGSFLNPKLLQLGVFHVGMDDLQPPPNTVVEQIATTARQRVRREVQRCSVNLSIRAFLGGFGGYCDNSMNVDSASMFAFITPTGRDLVRQWLIIQSLSVLR
jgi:hypothetical protein